MANNDRKTLAKSTRPLKNPGRSPGGRLGQRIGRDAHDRARDGHDDPQAGSGTPGGGTGPEPDRPVPLTDLEIPPAKFLLLEVPNFNRAEDPAEQMGSYLRLGSVPDPWMAGVPDAPRATGEDLAAYAWYFLDDERKRDGSPDFVPVEERIEETDRLHLKGGWRDHSDGNRISTTRGDKVEVIRGNYKMIVLGRRDEPVGWDASGGHLEGVGASSCIEWVQTFDGTWKTVETSEKGDTDVTQHGNSINRNFGEHQTNITGSEDEMRPAQDDEGKPVSVPSPNPILLDRTWARKIESYTGSAGFKIPLIHDETWARVLESRTRADEMSDDTEVKGRMTTTTVAGTLEDTTIVGLLSSVTLGNTVNLAVGDTASINVGRMANITVGQMLEVTVALMVDIFVGGALSVSVGPRQEISLLNATEVSPNRQEVAGTVARTVGAEVATGGIYKGTYGMMLLG